MHGARRPTTSVRSPSPPPDAGSGLVSIAPLKEVVRRIRADHPLRIVLQAEPDRMSREEYLRRLDLWLRLLTVAPV